MAARNDAKPAFEDLDATFADLSIISDKVGYCCPRGTTDATRDGEGVTRAVSMILAL